MFAGCSLTSKHLDLGKVLKWCKKQNCFFPPCSPILPNFPGKKVYDVQSSHFLDGTYQVTLPNPTVINSYLSVPAKGSSAFACTHCMPKVWPFKRRNSIWWFLKNDLCLSFSLFSPPPLFFLSSTNSHFSQFASVLFWMWTLGKGQHLSENREWKMLLSWWAKQGFVPLKRPKPVVFVESVEGFSISRQTYEVVRAKHYRLLIQTYWKSEAA